MKSPNQTLEPTAGRCEVQISFMKPFLMLAALALATIPERAAVNHGAM